MRNILVFLISLSFIIAFATVGICKNVLVAAWSFDKDTAPVVTDVSGNRHNGVVRDAKFVNGKFGKALEFDGTTSSVEVPHNDVFNIKDAITVEAWVKPSRYNDLSAVAQKWGDVSNRRQYLLCFVSNKVRFYISGSGNTWPSAESATAINTNDWTHLAGTYDSKAIKVYINGKLDGETANTEGLFTSDIPVWIGGYGPDAEFGSNRHFPGVIDEVRFWSGALSENEIKQGMNNPIAAVDSKSKLSTTWGGIKNAD